MEIEFDPEKDRTNRKEARRLACAAADINLDEAIVLEDRRFDYGETRFLAYAPINGRFHVLWFTMRGSTIRVIGLRKANDRERRRYERSP